MDSKDLTPELKQQLKDLELYISDDEFEKFKRPGANLDQEAQQPPPGYEDALATPIIEVFSVIVETRFDNDTSSSPCEIYGSIRAMEGQDTSFHLYDRDPEDSETIWKHGSLSLIGAKDRVMLPFTGVTLDVCLKDRIRQVEVIKGNVKFDDSLVAGKEEDSFDKLMKAVIQGEYGSAHVYYAIFHFGIWCTLEATITNLRGNGSGSYSDIFGTLVASYDNSRRYCSTDDEVKYLESTLFNKSYDKPIHMMVGNPIQLSRCVVVMPAYSSLQVEAHLWDPSGMIANDNLQFIARDRGKDTQFINSPHASLQVKVKWSEAYVEFYNGQMSKAESKLVEDINQEEMQKRCKVIHDQPLLSSSSASGSLNTSKYYGLPFTEILSICIGGITEEIHALCGTIIVDESLRQFHIYNKDESCFELLEDNNIASTEGPYHVIPNCDFFISLNLKDPVRDLEVSKGHFGWTVGQLNRNNMSWYNKRMCSVVRGKDGFAAVHYMIFDHALEAHVEVRFFSNSPVDVPANVYGHLVAYYRSYDYSKSYQRKYYRSRLFDLPQNKSVELMMGSKLTLSRSVVAVPTFSSLFIEANLEVCGLTGVCRGPVSGTVEFEIDKSCTQKEIIKGDNCWIELSVRF